MEKNEKEKPQDIEAISNTVAQDIEKTVIEPDAMTTVAENAANLNKGGEVIKDVDGNVFNPDMHASDKAGNPSYTQTGRFKKKPGRKVNAPEKAGAVNNAPAVGSFEAACAATGIFVQTGVALFGDEWQPEELPHANEEAIMCGAFTKYFEAKGVSDIPPGAALAIALVSYSARRFSKPKTKTQLAKMKDWLIAKVMNIKVKNNGSLFNNWKNGKRKNDTGATTGGKSKEQGNSDTGARSPIQPQ